VVSDVTELEFVGLSVTSGTGKATVTGDGPASYFKIEDRKAANTNGGSSSAGTNIRNLNTIVNDSDSVVISLTSNRIKLPAGTYRCDIVVPGYRGNRHQAYLYNYTDSAVISDCIGSSAVAENGSYVLNNSYIRGQFVLTAEAEIEVRQYIQTAVATYGLGYTANSGLADVYTSAQFWKTG
jgi:hypothetical protein